MLKTKLLSVSLLAVTSLLAADAAWAQEHNTANGDEIVVTARKKTETLHEVPLQISVFGSETIQTRDFRDIGDLAQSTPGLDYENYATCGLSTAPVVRGMAQTFTTSRVQNTAVFLDGIYLQRQSMVNPGLMETERVEVVKGPQSAVYGRNAFSGSINYLTKGPTDEFTASIGGTVGSGGRYDYQGTISGPIIENVLSARLSYGKSDFDGHTDNDHPFANDGPSKQGTNDKLGGWDDENIHAALTFKPVDSVEVDASYYRNESSREPQAFYYLSGARSVANDETWTAADNQTNCVNTSSLRQVQTGAAPINVPVFGNHAYCGELPSTPPFDRALDAAGYQQGGLYVDPRSHVMDAKSEIYQINASWDINDRFNLRYQFGDVSHAAGGFGTAEGRDSLVGSLVTQPGPPFPPPPQFRYTTFNANPIESLESQSHEIWLGYTGDNFTTSLGAFFSDTKDTSSSFFYFPEPCNNAVTCGQAVPNTSAAAPTFISFVPFPGGPTVSFPFYPFAGHGVAGNQTFYEDDVMAIFGNAEWELSDVLTLSVEARYEEEKKKFIQTTSTFGTAAPLNAADDSSFFTPRVTLRWTPSDHQMLYALVAKGVKTGGFNSVDPTTHPNQLTYDQEENWTYEVGGRLTAMDNRLTLSGAAYYIDWTGIQGTEAADTVVAFATDVTGNIGDAEVFGVELEGNLALSDSFFIDFSATVLDPKYKKAIYESAKTVNPDGTPDLSSSWGCTDLTPECNANGDVSGNRIERTSSQQASLGLNFHRPVNIVRDWNMNARWDFSWRNKMYATPLNLAHNGDRLLSNASLSFTDDNLTVSFWGKNIFNEGYVANSFVLPSFNRYIVGLGAERTYGVTAKYDF